MPIIKIKPQSGFVIISNDTLRDKRLGLDTRGFLAEILTHTEGLNVSVEWLMKHFGIGRDKLLRMTRELKACGYLETPTLIGEKGYFEGVEWVFYGDDQTGVRETRTADEPYPPLKKEDQREEEENKTIMPTSRKAGKSGLVVQVFKYWQQALNHPRSILDAKRKRLIEARLKDGYSAEDLEQAIRGIKRSPHNMGVNDTGTIYDDITLICRDAAHVDRFMGYDEQQTKQEEIKASRPSLVTYESAEERNWRESIGYYAKPK